MVESDTNRPRLLIDMYGVKPPTLPPGQTAAFYPLEQAVQIASRIYAIQRMLIEPIKDCIDEMAKEDPYAKHPLTFPDDKGRFIPFSAHPDIVPHLETAQSLILIAARSARESGDSSYADYLRIVGMSLVLNTEDERQLSVKEQIRLTSRRREATIAAYLRTISSTPLNFHFEQFEKEEGGKLMFQALLGSRDEDDTSRMVADMSALNKAGLRKYGSRWFGHITRVRVDSVSARGGSLASELRRNSKDDDRNPTGHNVPNEQRFVGKYGNLINFFKEPLQEKTVSIAATEAEYVAADLIVGERDVQSFVNGHEALHNFRPFNKSLGWLESALRESFANFAGLDLAADVWGIEDPTHFLSMVKGGLGYALADCFPFIINPTLSRDLESLVKVSSYIPGNMGYLVGGLELGGLVISGKLIGGINERSMRRFVCEQTREEKRILSKGTFTDARDHFEAFIPKGLILPIIDPNNNHPYELTA